MAVCMALGHIYQCNIYDNGLLTYNNIVGVLLVLGCSGIIN